MFFEDLGQIFEIAQKVGCSVFVVPDAGAVEISEKQGSKKLSGAVQSSDVVVLEPKEKTVITMEQVQGALERLSLRQERDLFILIRPAEKMEIATANALLKSLEEPKEKVHFILVTDAVSKILPTILSRSAVYFLRTEYSDEILADEKTKAVAKRLLVAKGAELVSIAEEIAKKKDGVRAYALSVLSVAIEMLYKSYYKTGKGAFLLKVPKFLAAYENIKNNGHVKLHLVADLC